MSVFPIYRAMRTRKKTIKIAGISNEKDRREEMRRILNRLAQSVLIMFLVSILCFALTKAAPGDPVMTYVEPNMSEEYIEQLREDLGLNKPLVEQYGIWLKNILQGNFGNSLMNKRPVLTQILERLPATILLMGSSLVLSVILAIPIGL